MFEFYKTSESIKVKENTINPEYNVPLVTVPTTLLSMCGTFSRQGVRNGS